MVKIIQKDNKILRNTSKEVPLNDISSKKIQKIIKDMKEALASQDDGVAIAAPQIGENLRIFVVSGKIFSFLEDVSTNKQEKKVKVNHKDLVFINPVIVKLSKKKMKVEEGCLSVRYLYGLVNRSHKATIKAYDENGNLFTKGASGLLSQIFQHETDHLNGVLFIDKAENIEDIPPEYTK